jgi:hypothetical protein
MVNRHLEIIEPILCMIVLLVLLSSSDSVAKKSARVFYPADLKNSEIKADYIIIATNELFAHPELKTFAQHRSDFSGFDVAVVNCKNIYSHFPEIEKYNSIKSFLTFVYQNWSSLNLLDAHPRYVLLIGEGNPGSQNYIPAFDYFKNTVASDFWYSCVTDDNDDGIIDKYDKDFDLIVGRISIDDEKELKNIARKTIDYENRPREEDDWTRKVSLVGLFENDSTTTSRVEEMFQSIEKTVSGSNYFHIVEKLLKPDWESELLKYKFYNAFNEGIGIFNIHGHGDTQVLGNGAGWFLFDESDTNFIQNSGTLPVVMSFACNSGNFQDRYKDCIGELLLNMSNRGAVAFIGSTDAELLDINLELNLYLMQVLERIRDISLGEAFFYARQRIGAGYKYNLLGDPALSISGITNSNTLLSDLILEPKDIHLSYSKDQNSQSTISANIQNQGSIQADDVLVRFYYVNPPDEELLIGDMLLSYIEPNGTFRQAFVYTDMLLERASKIVVKVDEQNDIAEFDEANNNASIQLLPDLFLSVNDITVTASVMPDYPDTLKATIYNLGFYEADNVLIQLYENDSQGNLVQFGSDIYVDRIRASRSIEVVLLIQHTFNEHFKFIVKVDPHNTIQETNEENNTANVYERFLPDLTIQPKDIHHYRVAPQHNKDRISLKIYNYGLTDANDVVVRIFLGHPDIGGVQIGKDIIIDLIRGGGAYAHITEMIDHLEDKKILFCVLVDPHDTIAEIDESNNFAQSLSIRSIFNTAEEFPNSKQTSYSAVGDFNNDALLDFLILNDESIRLYKNNANNSFTLQNIKTGLTELSGIYAPTFVDYDNDGILDIYLADSHLYKNSFSDGLEKATLNDPLGNQIKTGNVLSFFDANNDGRIDILSYYYGSMENNREFLEPLYLQKLLKNNGKGFFSDVTFESGLYPKLDPSMGGSVSAIGDYDNDGDSDIYLAVNNTFNNVTHKSQRLYANNGDGVFEDVTAIVGMPEHIDHVVTKAEFSDIDNDGDIDLIIGGHAPKLIIYENTNDGTFREKSTTIDLASKEFHTVIDYNNDGFVDLFFSVFENESLQSWMFFRNNKSGGFESDEEASRSYKSIPNLLSTAFGDYNSDGFIDMLCSFRDTSTVLYQNYGNTNNWLHINLTGVKSNSFGIGARVKVVAGDLVQTKDMLCPVDAIQKIQHSQTLEFGLGEHSSIDSILVSWPSGAKTVLTNEKINSILNIKENSTAIEIPDSFSLYQNYPNPFNKNTTIKYELPAAGVVKLEIFDILGRHVAILVEELKQAGHYSASWDGINDLNFPVAAGVYFYRFETIDFVNTYKMALVK